MPAAGHTTNAFPAIAPWVLALAPRQELEQPQHVHVVTAMPNHQAMRRLAVSPCFPRSKHSTHTTQLRSSRRTGNQIAARASWSRDSRLKEGNCFSGLESDAFWVFLGIASIFNSSSVYTRSLPVLR